MKILIVTHGRAGSTSLQYALSDVLNIEKIIEPFNTDLWENSFKSEPNYKGVEIPNNSIFKVIIGQDDDWILDKIYDFDKVIISQPNFAEAWNKRATAHFMMGNFDLSMQDISQTLQLEPRHFGALDGMSLIFIDTNQYEKAIEIYDKMLEIFPYSIGTQLKKEKMLSLSNKST